MKEESQWAKMSRFPKPTEKEALLKALEGDSDDIHIQGIPEVPSMPLFGSENVPISATEEKIEAN